MSTSDTGQSSIDKGGAETSGVNIRFLGSGDAFGSGGRMQPCIYVDSPSTCFLLDCGASALISMNRLQVDTNRIDLILVSHLHGDHFGGIPFFIIHAQLVSKRTKPLVIAGPPGLKARMRDAMELLFPGSSRVERKFTTEFVELAEEVPARIGSLSVTPYQVIHASGDVPYALRIVCEGKVIAYSGDTEWTDVLLSVANGADLFICETYYFDKSIKYHLNYHTLKERQADLGCKRTIITHMSNDVLSRLDSIDLEYAEDGKQISI